MHPNKLNIQVGQVIKRIKTCFIRVNFVFSRIYLQPFRIYCLQFLSLHKDFIAKNFHTKLKVLNIWLQNYEEKSESINYQEIWDEKRDKKTLRANLLFYTKYIMAVILISWQIDNLTCLTQFYMYIYIDLSIRSHLYIFTPHEPLTNLINFLLVELITIIKSYIYVCVGIHAHEKNPLK